MKTRQKKKNHQKANKHLSQLSDRSYLDEKPLRNRTFFFFGGGGGESFLSKIRANLIKKAQSSL